MNKYSLSKNNIAVFIAILFHVCGAVGILVSSHRNWFIQNTPIDLILMTALLIWTQQKVNKAFGLFFIICFITGFIAEVIGVNTALLFGKYTYGKVLGFQLFKVPLLIGFNWFIITYCSGVIVKKFDDRLLKNMNDAVDFSSPLLTFSFVIDAALLAAFFDWLIEPAAIKLGYWQWLENGQPPLYNYTCWFMLSALLLLVFHKMKFNKDNHFAVHLFIIQFLFFLALRIFL